MYKPAAPIFGAALLIAGLGPAHAADPDPTELIVPVKAWVDAVNRWDAAFPAAAFTDDAVVIDEFPGFLWTGNGGAKIWWGRLVGDSPDKHEELRAMRKHLDFGKPRYVQLKDRSAFFVVPATLSLTVETQRRRIHAEWVFTEIKTPDGWRITSFADVPESKTVQ
jgi:hypothetical protein